MKIKKIDQWKRRKILRVQIEIEELHKLRREHEWAFSMLRCIMKDYDQYGEDVCKDAGEKLARAIELQVNDIKDHMEAFDIKPRE